LPIHNPSLPMAVQSNNSNTPPASPSILHSPSQSESLSSKFLRKSKLLMKSNVNVESSEPDSCTSSNDPFPNSVPSSPSPNHQSPSEMTAPKAGSDINPITHPSTGVVLDTAKDLQNNKEAASLTIPGPSSPVNRSPPSPVMEIIPPSLSHRLQVTTSLESAASVASSDTNFTSTSELTEIQHTPLTESQIDDAKNLVLDLLGWGVDPEYLVTSGVHPELIYRIFTDLNLRLPTNLVIFDDGQ